MKNSAKIMTMLLLMALTVFLSACNQSEKSSSDVPAADNQIEEQNPAEELEEVDKQEKENETGSELTEEKMPVSEQNEQQKPVNEQVLMLIDQTEDPTKVSTNHFYFHIKQLPKGYALKEMKWKSSQVITNSFEEAISNGQTGELGFYISGNGQFMGFFYDPSLKGEKGEAIFTFENENQQQIEWKKTITLK